MEYRGISTRRGDDGRSDMFSGERRAKSDALFDALGDLDELNSYLGVVRHALDRFQRSSEEEFAGEGIRGPAGSERGSAATEVGTLLDRIQPALIAIASVVATEPESARASLTPGISTSEIAELESAERRYRQVTEIGTSFVVPGASGGVPEVDVARALCRRCERRIVEVMRERRSGNEGSATEGSAEERSGEDKMALSQRYLNRLADLLFVLARYLEQE